MIRRASHGARRGSCSWAPRSARQCGPARPRTFSSPRTPLGPAGARPQPRPTACCSDVSSAVRGRGTALGSFQPPDVLGRRPWCSPCQSALPLPGRVTFRHGRTSRSLQLPCPRRCERGPLSLPSRAPRSCLRAAPGSPAARRGSARNYLRSPHTAPPAAAALRNPAGEHEAHPPSPANACCSFFCVFLLFYKGHPNE